MYLSEMFLFHNFLNLYCSYLAHCWIGKYDMPAFPYEQPKKFISK